MAHAQGHELLRVMGDALASRKQQHVITGQFRSVLGKCAPDTDTDADQLANQLHDLLSLLDAAHATSGVQRCRSRRHE